MIIDIIEVKKIFLEELKKINPDYEIKLLIDDTTLTYEFQITKRFSKECSIFRVNSKIIALTMVNDFREAIKDLG